MPRSEFQVLNGRHPVDGGTLYFETDLNALIQEPFNMASAAVFVALAFYWSRALRGTGRELRWIRQALILLWIGAVGGTIYHGFRLHAFFILMDWLPILMLIVIAAWKFWLAWTGGVKAAAASLAASFGAQALGYRLLNTQYALTVGYLLMALSLIVPMVVQVLRHAVLRRPFALALLFSEPPSPCAAATPKAGSPWDPIFCGTSLVPSPRTLPSSWWRISREFRQIP